MGKALKRRLPRIGGCFAAALDGCFGCADAALLAPYEPAAGLPTEAARGVLYYSDDQVGAFCREANRRGLQIEMHAIGDAAFDQAVAALAGALADSPRDDHRHTIIHACLPTARGLETCARLGIRIAVQPAFLQWEQEPLEYIESILGARAFGISPLRTMTDLGIELSAARTRPARRPIRFREYGRHATTTSPANRSRSRKRSTSTRATRRGAASTKRSAAASKPGSWPT